MASVNISEKHFLYRRLKLLRIVELCSNTVLFPFVAESAKLSPASRYYLYGSPFTCMIAVRLHHIYCILDVLLYIQTYFILQETWIHWRLFFSAKQCCGWFEGVLQCWHSVHFYDSVLSHCLLDICKIVFAQTFSNLVLFTRRYALVMIYIAMSRSFRLPIGSFPGSVSWLFVLVIG